MLEAGCAVTTVWLVTGVHAFFLFLQLNLEYRRISNAGLVPGSYDMVWLRANREFINDLENGDES